MEQKMKETHKVFKYKEVKETRVDQSKHERREKRLPPLLFFYWVWKFLQQSRAHPFFEFHYTNYYFFFQKNIPPETTDVRHLLNAVGHSTITHFFYGGAEVYGAKWRLLLPISNFKNKKIFLKF